MKSRNHVLIVVLAVASVFTCGESGSVLAAKTMDLSATPVPSTITRSQLALAPSEWPRERIGNVLSFDLPAPTPDNGVTDADGTRHFAVCGGDTLLDVWSNPTGAAWCYSGASLGIAQTAHIRESSSYQAVLGYAAVVFGSEQQAQIAYEDQADQTGVREQWVFNPGGPFTVVHYKAGYQDNSQEHYMVWRICDIVVEVGMEFPAGKRLESSADPQFQSFVFSVADMFPLASEGKSAPTSVLSATNAPTPRPTATLTATPRPTATVTPTSRLTWSVASAKVTYGSANPERWISRASLTRVTVGQKVKLLLYATFNGIQSNTATTAALKVTEAGRTAYYTKATSALTTSDNGGYEVWSALFTPKTPGNYSLTGTVFVGQRHQHKTVTFSVQAH